MCGSKWGLGTNFWCGGRQSWIGGMGIENLIPSTLNFISPLAVDSKEPVWIRCSKMNSLSGESMLYLSSQVKVFTFSANEGSLSKKLIPSNLYFLN